MDWNETDPPSLRVSNTPNPPNSPIEDKPIEDLLAALEHPEHPTRASIPFAPPAGKSVLVRTRTEGVSGSIAANAVLESQEGMPAALPPGEMSPSDLTNAAIWHKLSFLVRTPPRYNGVWPLLPPLAGIAMFGSLVAGNGWSLFAFSLLLAAALKNNATFALKENTREALNMAPFDLRWVGPLAQALNSPHARVQGVATHILTHLLPHLRSTDTALLNTQQRAYLNQKLFRNRRRDSDLNIAILLAWATVGDSEAQPYVERLANGFAWTGEQQQVREAARACLPTLEKRLEAEHEMSRLRALALSGDANAAENVPVSSGTRMVIAEVSSQLNKLDEERRKHSSPGMRLGFLLASWLTIVPYTAVQTWISFFVYQSWGWGVMWALLTLIATQLHRFTLSLKQSETARKLAHTDDVRAVGPLAEALEWPDATVQRAAADALTRLLPLLNATDGNLLNAKQRANLYNLLRMRCVHSHHRLIVAILRALEQVGDQAAIPAVERLAKAHAYTPKQLDVKKLAQDIMPNLENSARQQSVSSTLLRASSAQETPSELLLRGAMPTHDDAPQQLLRASGGEGSGE